MYSFKIKATKLGNVIKTSEFLRTLVEHKRIYLFDNHLSLRTDTFRFCQVEKSGNSLNFRGFSGFHIFVMKCFLNILEPFKNKFPLKFDVTMWKSRKFQFVLLLVVSGACSQKIEKGIITSGTCRLPQISWTKVDEETIVMKLGRSKRLRGTNDITRKVIEQTNSTKKLEVSAEFFESYLRMRRSLCFVLDALQSGRISTEVGRKEAIDLFVEISSSMNNYADSLKNTKKN